ncbi:MAG: flavin reductase [Ruminococcus sp.]|nr:flavin reductase [Ruminococcus sp.]
MDKKAMYKLSYGLFVVTARQDGFDNGCITNTVGQVTTTPNRISLTVNKDNLTHEMIQNTAKFNVSVISKAADFALFKRFGFQSGRDADKFEGFGKCNRSSNDLYYVTEGTNAFMSAKVCQAIDLGTHTMFIADITDMEVLDDTPSSTYEYYLSNIKPRPSEVGKTPEGKTIWRCIICGYEYIGDELPEDFVCPICKHPASDFEKVTGGAPAPEEAVPVGKTPEGKTIWRCTVCGYEYEGDELPEDFECPICGVGPSEFEKV